MWLINIGLCASATKNYDQFQLAWRDKNVVELPSQVSI